jgi:hypothetical protein
LELRDQRTQFRVLGPQARVLFLKPHGREYITSPGQV